MQVLSKINKQSSFFASLISVIMGLLVGGVMMILAGYNPIQAYIALFQSAFLQPFDIGETIRSITPLILTGLAVGLAFRTGLFNIGVEGQFIIGQLAAVIVAIKLDLPPVLHAIVAVIAGALGGALWAFLPGYLKAKRGVHEVITTIMMNFIALYLSNLAVTEWLTEGADKTKNVPESASLHWSFLSQMFDGSSVHFGIFIAIVAAIFMYYLLWKTTTGYQLRAVGFNPHASEYAGMNVSRNIVLSMMISGIFAGLAGASELLGTSGYQSIQASYTGIGFDGIAVSLLGGNTPFGIVLSASLFGILTYGGSNMEFVAGVPREVIRVVFAAIIFFVAANIVRWASQRRKKKKVKESNEKAVKSGD
ncbi:simple sugar transport system permease protein [Marininema mesophilum]|uniref:Simple sugar transport system permease protein n=1 Tax=Marininema mesophilum TaxID=1048340 RepID=A0A1H2SQI1_9BACL|nr:ABC transporter permease [Marininema mesophilum]SDW33838.1 simple sugar transport system permease protein [Marininema mesophilum]